MIKTLKLGSLTMGTLSSGYIFNKLTGFGFPSVRVNVKDRGSMHGADLSSYLYGRRAFVVELTIIGTSKTDYETKRRALEEACDIYNGTTTLTIYTKSGMVLQSTVIVSDTVDMPYEKGTMIFSEARLEMTAPYPFIKGYSTESKMVSIWAGGGFAIPFEVPMDMSAGASVVDTVTNNGNAIAFPILILNGKLEDAVIINESTGDEMNIDYNLTNGNYIEIDTYNRTALLNGVTNVRQYLSGDWIKLVSGENNIKLSATSFDSAGNILVSWKDSYLGV